MPCVKVKKYDKKPQINHICVTTKKTFLSSWRQVSKSLALYNNNNNQNMLDDNYRVFHFQYVCVLNISYDTCLFFSIMLWWLQFLSIFKNGPGELAEHLIQEGGISKGIQSLQESNMAAVGCDNYGNVVAVICVFQRYGWRREMM